MSIVYTSPSTSVHNQIGTVEYKNGSYLLKYSIGPSTSTSILTTKDIIGTVIEVSDQRFLMMRKYKEIYKAPDELIRLNKNGTIVIDKVALKESLEDEEYKLLYDTIHYMMDEHKRDMMSTLDKRTKPFEPARSAILDDTWNINII